MSSIFDFPEPVETHVIKTGMIRLAIRRTRAIHHLGGFCVWSGRAGMGKTTAAEQMVKLIEEAYDPENPRAFRAVLYEAGSVQDWSKHEAKRGIRSLYCGVGCSLDEGVYRSYLPEELAADLVHFLIKMNIQFIFADEAGLLSLSAIRGMVTVSDTARLKRWPLTIILIGMDNLPTMVTKITQVDRRVYDWIYFKPCTIEETHKLLATLHPYFRGLNLKNRDHKRQVQYIHDACKGIPGSVVLFVVRFTNLLNELPLDDPMVHIQAAHIQPLFDRSLCINDSQSNYQGLLEEYDEEAGASQGLKEKDSSGTVESSAVGQTSETAQATDNVVAFPTG